MLLLSYFLYLLYTVNQFSFTHFRYCVSTFSYKHMPQCKFSLYLKKAGLASRNIVHFLKKVILRCIGLCFNYHHKIWYSIFCWLHKFAFSINISIIYRYMSVQKGNTWLKLFKNEFYSHAINMAGASQTCTVAPSQALSVGLDS